MQLSVIVCTHNPRRDYFIRVLDALRNQTLPKDQWELIIVDNASKVPLASEWDLSWHPNGRLLWKASLVWPQRVGGACEKRPAMY